MGRTRKAIAKAAIKTLTKKVKHARKKEKELLNYLEELDKKYLKKEVSFAFHVETIHRKRDGKIRN